jgi:predicted HTH transcriptional regulator
MVNIAQSSAGQYYQEGFFVFDIATFNERVVREAILNAVSHRNYQFGGSIFVRQFRDKLVVESPGSLPDYRRIVPRTATYGKDAVSLKPAD